MMIPTVDLDSAADLPRTHTTDLRKQSETRRVQALRAENDALRADIDGLLAELDERSASVHALRERQSHTTAELAAARLREEAARAASTVTAYRQSVEQQLKLQHDAAAQQLHELALVIEHARIDLARNNNQLQAELDATRRTFSWRVTAPLRGIRRLADTVAAYVSRGRWPLSAPRVLDEPANFDIPPAPFKLADTPLIDLDHYRRCYPGLALFSDADLVSHYVRFGYLEGRSARSPLQSSRTIASPEIDEREAVVVIMLGDPEPQLTSQFFSLAEELDRTHHVVAVIGAQLEHEAVNANPRVTTLILDEEFEMVGDAPLALMAELALQWHPACAILMTGAPETLRPASQHARIPVLEADEMRAGNRFAVPDMAELSRDLDGAKSKPNSHRFAYAVSARDLSSRIDLARAQYDHDQEQLLECDGFDEEYYAGPSTIDRHGLSARYLHETRMAFPLSSPNGMLTLDRPRPGFHPLVYAESAPGFIDDGRDPLAHYLASGQPAGRWTRRLITPNTIDRIAGQPRAPLRVLVHGHFYYPELAAEFLDLLSANHRQMTIVLTTDTPEKAQQLDSVARRYRSNWNLAVHTVANRGRNLSALFTGPVARMIQQYDVVLHVHGKRSPQAANGAGDRWRRHLWTHLIGDGFAFADQIISEFENSDTLGLVSPEDHRLHDWDGNRAHVEPLIARLAPQLSNTREVHIPTHFDFPVGAMFWARVDALAPFMNSELSAEDFPAEPLPVDGTRLHALERLVPLLVEHQGFAFAKTHLQRLRF